MSERHKGETLTIVTKQPIQAFGSTTNIMLKSHAVHGPNYNLFFYEYECLADLPDSIKIAGRVFHRCCEKYYLDTSENGLVRPFFDHLSGSYQIAVLKQRNVESYKWVFAELLKNCKQNHGWILDIGAGHGFGVKTYQEIPHGKLRLVAMDMSRRMLMKCPEGSEQIVSQAEYLSVKNDCLSGVVAVYMLHYLPNPKDVFKEIARTLVQGGVLGFVAYRHDPHKGRYHGILKATGFEIVKFEKNDHNPPEYRVIAVKL